MTPPPRISMAEVPNWAVPADDAPFTQMQGTDIGHLLSKPVPAIFGLESIRGL